MDRAQMSLLTLNLLALVITSATGLVQQQCVGDVYFLIDSTMPVSKAEFSKEMNFISNLILEHPVGPRGMRYGAMITSTTARQLFQLKNIYTQQTMAKRVRAIVPMLPNKKVWIEKGLSQINALNSLGQLAGGRPEAKDLLVIFSEGVTASPQKAIDWSKVWKNKGINILTVQVGKATNNYLASIASGPKDSFKVSSYDDLHTIKAQLLNRICNYSYVPPPTPDTQKCKKNVVDLIFVLDNSLSIGKANYKKEIQLTSDLISVFNVAPNYARVGAMVFNKSPQKLFDLGTYPSSSGVLQALQRAPPLKLGTYTDLALNYVVDNGMFSPRAGGRPVANNVVVVLTDGLSRSVVKTEKAAQRVKAQNTIIVAVGFGAANDRELKKIASGPQYVFKAKDINQLLDTKWNVAELICKASEEDIVSTPAPTNLPPIKTTAAPLLCQSMSDIIFVLDSSGSIGQSNFGKVLNFAARLVGRFSVGPGASQFGSVVFSHVAKKQFDLRDFEDQETVIESLMETPYLSSTTNTSSAFDLITDESMLEKIRGGRDGASKIVILVTDGRSNQPDKTKQAAERLKKQNVQIVTVGVGNADNAELTALASSKSNVFYVKDFTAMDRIASEVSDRVCQASADAPPFIPAPVDECDYDEYEEYVE